MKQRIKFILLIGFVNILIGLVVAGVLGFMVYLSHYFLGNGLEDRIEAAAISVFLVGATAGVLRALIVVISLLRK